MKKFIFFVVSIFVCMNIMCISSADKISSKSDIVFSNYKLDGNEFMGEYKKGLIGAFNKRIDNLRLGRLNIGSSERILVIPLEFKDVKFKVDIKEYEETLDKLREYYEMNSGYKKGEKGITIEYTITDKVTSKYDMKHYATDINGNITNDEGIFACDMVREATKILQESGFNFEEYDNNEDGIVDHVMVIHAGIGQEESLDKDYIWSHYSEIFNGGVKVGNVVVLNYITVPENTNVGTIAHEFGHDLGLPDLYDVSRASNGVGLWDIMAAGSINCKEGQNLGECPTNLCAWSREIFGWGEIEEVNESKELVFKNSNGISNIYKVYLRDKYGRKSSSEYYLLEYKRKIGYDEALPGEGILIWHVDENVIRNGFFTNLLNVNSKKMGVNLVQADGKFHLEAEGEINLGDCGDPFPGDDLDNIFGAVPNKLNFDNSGNYSFIEGRNFKLNGDTATMYIDLDIKAPDEKIKMYAPLDGSKVGGDIVFCCDLIPKCSDYKLQISDNKEFLFPLQYSVCDDFYHLGIKNDKVLFSRNLDNVLEDGKEYYWRVAPVNPLTNMENLIWSDSKKIIFVGDKDLDVPGNLSFDITDKKIKVSWVKEEGATSYIVLCNEEEREVKNNMFEIKNDKTEYRVRVRSVGKYSASGFGEEIVIKTLKQPSINVEVIENDLTLPEYILINIKDGTFKKSGNYNETTVNIKKIPIGIKQSEVSLVDDKTIRVNLEKKYSFALDKDTKLKVVVCGNLINDFHERNLSSEFVLGSNNKNRVDKLSFNFDGENALKIIGIKKGMEYSIDGGISYKKCTKEDMKLDNEQVGSLNKSDGIIVKAGKDKYYIINILENIQKPTLVLDYDNNTLRGLTKDMEYSFDKIDWIGYDEEDLDEVEGSMWVRYKGHGRMKMGDSVELKFPSIKEKNDNKKIA